MSCVNYDFDHMFTTDSLSRLIRDPIVVNLTTADDVRRYGQMADCISFKSRESAEQNRRKAMEAAPNATRVLIFEDDGLHEMLIAGRSPYRPVVC